MRVLHVSDVYLPRLGGIERQVADLASQQRRRGDHVHVLTSTEAGTSASDRHVTRRPFAAPGVRQVLEDLRPDVVHAHASLVSPLTCTAARQAVALGIPTVITMHSMVQRHWPIPGGPGTMAWLVGSGALWTAVSQVAADALIRAIDRPVSVLANGVDPHMWRTSPVGERERLTVVSLMRLAARKRPMAFIDVLHQVARRLDGEVSWQAVIAGSGPQQAAVAREVRRRGLQDVVLLAGRLDRATVVDLLGTADLYVAPAVMESFGIAALEARCSGVPVVAMRSAGVSEFVTHGVHGELVDDDADLVQSIARLLRDRDQLRALAVGARNSVPHSWDAVLARCDRLYGRAAFHAASPSTAAPRSRR